jgi:cytochrome c-type biogenesis protein CcmE
MGSDGEMQEVAAGPASAPVKARRSGTSSRFLAAGAILAVAIAFLIYNGMQGAGAFYMTVEELQNTENITEGKQIRVGGNVVAGTIKQAGIGEEMYFEISDGVASVAIVYDGAPPDIFRRPCRSDRYRHHEPGWHVPRDRTADQVPITV